MRDSSPPLDPLAVPDSRIERPLILDIKGNALDDGPGIRSVVFFKGCPLSCVWCHNPESRRRTAELSFDAAVCIREDGCDRCVGVCPTGAVNVLDPALIDRTACTVCFACVDICPSGALRTMGTAWTVDEVLTHVLRDKPFYDASGGGVTFSGGEATLYPEFLGELAAYCRSEGIHTLLQTSGHFHWDVFQRAVLPHLDTIYYDLKLFDSAAHRQFCGLPNERIAQNFARLAQLSNRGEVDLLPRIPLIPELTATHRNIGAIGDFLLAHQIRRVRLLDYNPTWVDKTAQIGGWNDHASRGTMRTWLPAGVAADLRARLGELGIEAL